MRRRNPNRDTMYQVFSNESTPSLETSIYKYLHGVFERFMWLVDIDGLEFENSDVEDWHQMLLQYKGWCVEVPIFVEDIGFVLHMEIDMNKKETHVRLLKGKRIIAKHVFSSDDTFDTLRNLDEVQQTMKDHTYRFRKAIEKYITD